MTQKEIDVKRRCQAICNSVDETTATTMIEEEFQGCAVDIDMIYGDRGIKSFMGMIMWEDIIISF